MPRPEEMEDRKIYPAGDLPPEPDEEVYDDPEGDAGHADAGAEADAGQAGEQAGEGDQDWQERYKQLEQKLGQQGSELGTLRQQNQELQQALQQMQQQPQSEEGQQQANDLQTQLQGIRKQLDDGDLSPEEAMFQTAQVTSEMARMEADQIADQKLRKFQQDAEADKVLSRFHEQHPDFEELRQTGTLEEVKKQLPGLHDDFSAYYAHKAETSANEAYERGKKEMEKLAQGDAAAGKVLSKPGQTIRQKNQQPLTSDKDVKQSMMDRLKAVRQQGG